MGTYRGYHAGSDNFPVGPRREMFSALADYKNLIEKKCDEPPPPKPKPIKTPVVFNLDDINDIDPEDPEIPWKDGMYADKLYIYPPSAQVKLVVLGGTGATTEGDLLTTSDVSFGRNSADKPFDSEGLDPGDNQVQPFVLLGKRDNSDTSLTYLALKPFIVMKTAAGLTWHYAGQETACQESPTAYPTYVDLRLHWCKTKFAIEGVAKANVPVCCTLYFTSPEGRNESFHSHLDSNGAWHGVLAPDWISLCKIHSIGNGFAPVPIKPKPQPWSPPNVPNPPKPIVVDPKPPDALPDYCLAKAVFMCDHSGSMGSDMPSLRKSIINKIETYTSLDGPEGRPFAVMAWDNSVEWPTGGPCWITAADKSKISSWAESLQAEGGTAPSNALQSVASSPLGKQLRHIVILCDGQFNDLDEATLDELMTQMPQCKSISWVGFGSNADQRKMQSLVKGSGGYYQFKE